MIKIIDVVNGIISRDIDTQRQIINGYLNLRAYARHILPEVKRVSKKEVKEGTIVTSLSRLTPRIRKEYIEPIKNVKLQKVDIDTMLVEVIYKKTDSAFALVNKVYEIASKYPGNFLTITVATHDLTIICSSVIYEHMGKMKSKPMRIIFGLSAVKILLDEKYYDESGITYSLIKRIADKHIPLAETITTHREIIFVFPQQHITDVLNLYIN